MSHTHVPKVVCLTSQRTFRQRQKERRQATSRELQEVAALENWLIGYNVLFQKAGRPKSLCCWQATEKLRALNIEREQLQQRNNLLEKVLSSSQSKVWSKQLCRGCWSCQRHLQVAG